MLVFIPNYKGTRALTSIHVCVFADPSTDGWNILRTEELKKILDNEGC